MNSDYTIGIVGGGAVGLTYAALLSESANIVLKTRTQEQADAINEHGIEFRRRSGEKRAYLGISASSHYDALAKCDAIIVCVKSHDTETVAHEMQGYISDSASILSLQNGLLAYGALKSVLPHPDRVFAGVTYVGATRDGANIVTNGKMLKCVVDAGAGKLATIMHHSPFEAEMSSNIAQVMWDKMVLNVGQNALSAVTNLKFGEMYNSEYCLQIATELTNELVLVGKAEGLTFDYSPLDKLKANWQGSAFLPSMWQDLHSGRKTEVDAINGAISRLGKKHGIPTPYNDLITSLIHVLESREELIHSSKVS